MKPVVDAIICDQIRQEANGKLIAIGIYTDVMEVPEVPTQGVFTIWLRFIGLKAGSYQNTLIAKMNDVAITEADATLVSNGKPTINAFAFGFPVQITETGILSFEVKFGDDDPILAAALTVHVPESNSEPTESQSH